MATQNAINLTTAGITGYNGSGTFSGTAVSQYNVIVGGASSSTLANVAPSATAGIPLVSGGSSANPSFTTAVVEGGGTGATSFTAHSLLLGQGTSAVSALGAATNGQLPIGSTGADPVLATLTAGSGISISNGAGSITISAVSGGFAWSVVTGSTQAIAAGNGYFANNAGGVTFTLPASPSVGDTYQVVAMNAGGWTIGYGSGQKIFFGNTSTTTTSGTLASTSIGDSVELVCNVAGASANWYVVDSVGNITVT